VLPISTAAPVRLTSNGLTPWLRSMKSTLAALLLALLAPWAVVPAAEPAAGPDRLPAFSWDRVPRYMHVRKDVAFTPEELRYLASFPLVTLEKTTGIRDSGSTEAGTLAAARAIKQLNPATKVLYYRNVLVHYGGYAANASLEAIPRAFLVGSDGSDQLVRRRVQAYDLTNPRLRQWWLTHAQQVCADPAIDGLFLDGNIKVLEPAYLRNELGATRKAALAEGYAVMMQDTRRILGPAKLMLANVLRARLPDAGLGPLAAFDGSYLEGFDSAVGPLPWQDYVAKGIAAFREAARQGRLIAFTSGLGDEEPEEGTRNPQGTDEVRKPLGSAGPSARRFTFLLATFLICAERHSYFLAHDGYDARKSRVWLTSPPELERPLGPPLGPALRSGSTYTREFAHASVQLHLATRTGHITWK
jgi:hypothetical protein